MGNNDWSYLGDEIKDAVQSAVDSKDFTKLNDTVKKTVNQALDQFEKVLDGNGNKEPDENVKDRKRETVQTVEKNPFTSYKDRYAAPVSSSVFGILMSVFGWILAAGIGLTEFLLLLAAAFVFRGNQPDGMALAIGSLAPILLCGIFMVVKGGETLGRIRRYKKYVKFLKEQEYCALQDLEQAIHIPHKTLIKDLHWMIEKEWFLEGYLDDQETSLMVTRKAYMQYMDAKKEFLRKEAEKKQQEAVSGQKQSGEGSRTSKKDGTLVSGELSEEVQLVIQEGRGYLEEIRKSNDAIPGEEISIKISKLERVIGKIFNRVENHPELVEELRRFMKYYLPTTVKLLKAYEELYRQEVQGPNIVKSQKEIESTLDTINQAFENLLDGFFEDTAVDISSDISVMQTLMAQEGLLDDRIKEKQKEKVLR